MKIMKVDILGVKIDDLNVAEALLVVEKWIWNPGKHYIVTPNPEFLVAAQKDPVFKKILNDADLSIPDGRGLKLSGRIKNTFPGTDFMESLVILASEKGFVVGFLGGGDGVAKKTAECLKKKYSGLKVAFAENGGVVNDDGNVVARRVYPELVEGRQSTEGDPSSAFGGLRMTGGVDILFVAFGHIKQEKWIAANLKNIPVKIAMGVGGAFDYLSGSVPRAPKWIRGLGFEWLFRFFIQPWRIKRQLALLKYLWLLLLSSLPSPRLNRGS
ncbi:MAG: WecB/TagA/CpsF family glycosyltransferase [Candidatus Daviesbacteria bacterium]|nr:WecB/TagA/CpsF family glycosyltransferase [Candidatus Daviesbacteria bacterium]